VDSNEISFILAAQGAMKQVFEYGIWQMIEPIMTVEVIGPSEFMGATIAQVSRRSGYMKSSNEYDGWFTIVAEVPLNEMFGYTTELRTATQGKGEFTMEYCRYSPARGGLQSELVDRFRQDSLKSAKRN